MLIELIFLFETAFAHESTVGMTHSLPAIEKCLQIAPQLDRQHCLGLLCDASVECAKSLVQSATEAQGPEAGIAVLHDILGEEKYEIQTTGHDLAHIVGRITAQHFGMGNDAFIHCPVDFFYGCQHGFFEQALLETMNLAEAAQKICGGLQDKTERTQFFCYHGAGHGFMMSRGNNIAVALQACDELPNPVSQRGCAQGVFMENLNAYGQKKALPGYFDRDPLSPCNDVKPHYQWACYVNHGTYLLTTLRFWETMISACKKAAPDMIDVCIFSVGQLLSDPLWQGKIPTKKPLVANNDNEWVRELCLLVEDQYQPNCIAGAVEHWMNHFDDSNVLQFCSDLPASLLVGCFRHLGFSIKDRLFKTKITCDIVPKKFRSFCWEGIKSSYIPITSVPFTVEFLGNTEKKEGIMPTAIQEISRLMYMCKKRVLNLLQKDIRSSNTFIIYYDEKGFYPKILDISQGDSIEWVNNSDHVFWPASDPHPVHNLHPGFDSRNPLKPQEHWSFRFTKQGAWPYHNHWNASHTGAIVVQ